MSVLLHTFNYTGAEQTITLNPGTYKFKLWGGRGGDSSRGTGGATRYHGAKGGYAEGSINLAAPTEIKIYVGGGISPGDTTTNTGGWNGGGNGSTYYYRPGPGGGASDIRIGGSTLDDRILVAGGGAGSGESGNGGAGGGLTGGTGSGSGTGGTQSAGGTVGGAWGQGGNTGGFGRAPGGGGWFGGGSSSSNFEGGGGGSSYIGDTITINGINFPLIAIIDGYTESGVNNDGHGKVEIWSSGSPISAPSRRFVQFI